MAIAFDAAASGSGPGTGSLSWNHTCSGGNRVLIVGVTDQSGDGVSGVTYNSVAMTLLRKDAFNGTSFEHYVYYLIAPATGTHSVAVSATAGHTLYAVSISLTGATQYAFPDAHSKATGTSTASSSAVTTVADNCDVVFFTSDSGGTISSVTNGTSRATDGSGNNFGIGVAEVSALVHPAGASTVTANLASNTNWIGVSVSVAPVPPVTGQMLTVF